MSYLTRTVKYLFDNYIPPMPGSFISTPVVPQEQEYGYYPAKPGLLLNNGRYEVSRMLGSGQSSSVFLVRDLESDIDDDTIGKGSALF
jgi:hypothetical protein